MEDICPIWWKRHTITACLTPNTHIKQTKKLDLEPGTRMLKQLDLNTYEHIQPKELANLNEEGVLSASYEPVTLSSFPYLNKPTLP